MHFGLDFFNIVQILYCTDSISTLYRFHINMVQILYQLSKKTCLSVCMYMIIHMSPWVRTGIFIYAGACLCMVV